MSFIILKTRSASELEASCTKRQGRSCVASHVKNTTAPEAPDIDGLDLRVRGSNLVSAFELVSWYILSFVV